MYTKIMRNGCLVIVAILSVHNSSELLLRISKKFVSLYSKKIISEIKTLSFHLRI